MSEFNQQDVTNEYESHTEKQIMLDELKVIVEDSKAKLEGNSFYYHLTLHIYPDLYAKQVNLFWCGKQASTRICEIGFNAGHSTMLMLLGRDKTALEFTIFDIGHHPYTKPCLKYIESKFPNVNFEYVEGDSTITMPEWINNNTTKVFDVIHVDGGHSEHCITNDMKNADMLVKVNGLIIIDDTYMNHINKVVNNYISRNYRELVILKTKGYTHRIIQKIN
jgi:predicted O-methyltransferase YrrM